MPMGRKKPLQGVMQDEIPTIDPEHDEEDEDAELSGGAPAASASTGRTGIFVEFEGWLEKKTSTKPHRWQKRWFALMTKENNGLVDSRSLQYFSTQPSLDQEPEHAIPLAVGRKLEQYKPLQFRLRLPAPPVKTAAKIKMRLGDDDGERVYCFRAQTEVQAAAWLMALRDESNSSERRTRGLTAEEAQFLSASRAWMAEVLAKFNAPKVKDIDAMLEEWMGEEEDLLKTVAQKYFPNGPPTVWSSNTRVWAAVDSATPIENRMSPARMKKGKDYK